MKTWHALLISASLVCGGLLAGTRVALTDSGQWETISGLGGFFFNTGTREMIWCEVKQSSGKCFKTNF